MKILSVLIGFMLCIFTVQAQQSITIKVEDLKKPDQVLRVNSYQTILEDLIRADSGMSRYPLNKEHVDPAFNIIAKSNITDSMVSIGYHSFFQGMYNAYADHRPFTLSPDMMWLLICQGFANHVNNNSEELRSLLVDFKGKNTLIVRNDKILLNDPNSPWEEVFPDFSKQIAQFTGKQLAETMTSDFTTTTVVSRVASQITLMDAVKSYFDFVVMTIGCGIPKVTLQGTPKDWQKVLAKTEALRKYKLGWWVDEIEPVLKNIISASQGKTDKAFWQGMFKLHSKGGCGSPTIIDGWIVKFFPYSKAGKRNNLDSLSLRTDDFPNEIVKVDLKYLYGDGAGNFVTTPLELWAGFVGLKQDNQSFELTPQIGWMIRKKYTGPDNILIERFKKANSNINSWGGIMLTSKTVPPELLAIGPIHSLTINFTDDIQIPEEMGAINIGKFRMNGTITKAEISRISKLLPNTQLIINNVEVKRPQ